MRNLGWRRIIFFRQKRIIQRCSILWCKIMRTTKYVKGNRNIPILSLDWTQGNLREGLCCFHSGAFFEAHEHWESVWLAAQEPEKTFLQGLIQVAAAFHHFQRGNCAGTISLLRSGLRRLDGFQETFGGIGVAPLRASISLRLEALETVPQAPPPPHPQLQFA